MPKAGGVKWLIVVAFFTQLATTQDEEFDSRPYLQVLPDGNLVIAAATNRNLTFKTLGSGVVNVNGVNLANFIGNTGAACNSSYCSNGGTCIPAMSGAVCLCPPQWKGRRCQNDVDECRELRFAVCLNGASCRNSNGSFTCQCPPEFSGTFCEKPINDCISAATCGNGSCVDLARQVQGIANYRCICNSGWRQSANLLGPCNVDIDECAEGTHACSRLPRVACFNRPGSYSCGPCPAGYNTVGRDCVDVDECAASPAPCSRNPMVPCTNVPGSFVCGSCPSDYEGDGRTCRPINRCLSATSFCHPLATCVAIQNSALPQCNCPPGYSGSGYGPSGCFPLRSSTNGSSLCSPTTCYNGGTCQSPQGADYFTCLCPLGFSGRRCELNVNDCDNVRCANGGTCQDAVNGFRCVCPPRFTGRMCESELENCGGLLTNSSGTLTYPRFQTAYNHSMDCEWRIMVLSTSQILRVEFSSMDLELDPPDCNYDYVEVRDGPTSAYPLLFPRLCGRTVPAPRNSTRNTVIIRFHSDASHSAQGFTLRWRAVQPTCGGYLTQPFGTISSPGYPGPYPSSRTCVWRIALVPGSTIQFSFGSMDIESSSNCSADVLKLYDGFPPLVKVVLGSFCGRAVTLTPLRTTGNLATVMFTSNAIDSRSGGFTLQYTSTRSCGIDYSAPSGLITYPANGGNYLANALCHWSVVLPQDKQIQYTFERLDTEFSQGCSSDYVELRSGFDDETSQQLGKYCGRRANATEISGQTPGNTLLIKFRSDTNTLTGTGFKLRYKTACGGVFSDHTGRITSPNYPQNYPNSTEPCNYLITTGASLRLVLRFTSLDLQERDDCVEIFDGPSADESPLLRRSCGRATGFEINSTASNILVRFKAVVGGRSGFRAFYESIGFDCGGVLTEPHGVITSPGFPGRYPHGVSCYWAISAPTGHVVRLSFVTFSLENHDNCAYDFLHVYEDAHQGFNGTLGKYCGSTLPPAITSFSNILHLKFASDASVADVGFSASYVVLPATSACGGEIRQSYGLIRSPNYPNRYDNSASCEWTIIGKPGAQIKLNITDFDLEEPSQTGSCYDFVEMRHGSYASSPLIAKLCGSELRQRVYVAYSNRVWIRFVSDGSMTGRGFRIAFDATTTGCGGALSTPTGSITSPNFPNAYDHMGDCYWNIRVASGSRIRFTLPIVDLEDHARCSYDFVELRDGGAAGSLLGKYCNSTNTPAQMTTNSSRLWIRFRSDGSISGSGFMLNYRTICQGIELNALHGSIQSPGYPDLYPENLNCSWFITAPTGNRVNLTFSDFDIDRSVGCDMDYIAIYDIGLDNGRTLLQKICGYDIPSMITSRSNRVMVQFVSNSDTKSGDGFNLEYIVFGCGDIFTHNYGFITYETPENGDPNVECQWSIRAPVGRRILLSILDLNVGDMISEGQCEHASLQIFNSPSMEGNPVSTICGSMQDRNFTSTGNFITLHLNPIETYPNERSRIRAYYTFIDGGCGGSFSTPFGTISSPVQPGSAFYPANVFCQWFIHSQPMHSVNLTFRAFQVEDNLPLCSFDHVEVYDGLVKSNSSRLLRHCGLNLPQPLSYVSSHDNDMLVEMKADGTVQYQGFQAMFSEACGAFVNLTSDRPSVDFSSPNHPRPYPLGANCSWTFVARNGGRLMLEFTRFDLSNSTLPTSRSCSTYMRIFDGLESDAIELGGGRLCGSTLPISIFTRSSILVAKFITSPNLIPLTGFLATVTLLDQATSCGRFIEADHGVIGSPMYPDPYPPNFECIWTIKASPGNKIGIQFSAFSLQNSDDCVKDFVELREGGAGGRLLTSRLCGRTVPSIIQPANPVWVKFSSDATVQQRGFLLRFYTVYGGSYAGSAGQISSPNYPRNYGPNMDVRWIITVPQNFIVRLTFLAFDLENSYSTTPGNCLGDYLEIRDGSSPNSPMLNSRMCGRRANPREVLSTGNTLHVNLRTDSSIESFGFLANWTAVEWQPPTPGSIASSSCTFDWRINDTSRVIISLPSNASNSSFCIWRLRASTTGHLTFNVSQINVPYFGRYCYDTYVAFFETIYNRVVETRRLCGTQRPTTPITSITNDVTVIYKAPTSTNVFLPNSRASFNISAIEECGSMIMLPQGNITSPRYPQASRANTNCTWTILGKPGRTISARFSGQFGLSGQPPSCSESRVEIQTTQRNIFCGTTKPFDNYVSNSNFMTIFYSSGSGVPIAPGFRLTFKEVPYPCGDTIVLSADNPSATVTSPNFPQNYLAHLDCRWLVTAPVETTIRIHFDTVELESGYWGHCPHDSIELRDGSTTHAPLLQKICGVRTDLSTLRTSDNALLIRFISDESIEKKGFSLRLDISECGGTIYGTSGSFHSPRYPANYPARSECLWTIEAPQGHFVSITFSFFDLANPRAPSPCDSAEDDTVSVYDGTTLRDPLVETLCGNLYHRVPFTVNTSDSSALVRFLSNNDALTGSGFTATFKSSIEECGGDINATSGVIQSPNWPGAYPHLRTCHWTIRVPEGRRVRLSFANFSLENAHQSSNSCVYDYVAVYNGVHDKAPQIGRFCGNRVPNDVKSSMNLMTVIFRTDGSVSAGGFRATFDSFETQECGGYISLTSGSRGSITSPGYRPNNASATYNHSVWCSWKFLVPVGTSGTLLLSFVDLRLENHNTCAFDAVEIHEGLSLESDSLSMGVYCSGNETAGNATRSILPIDIATALGPSSVWVIFTTDSSVADAGFNLTYTFFNCGGRTALQPASWTTIRNPSYPSADQARQVCAWLGEGSPNSRVQFVVEDVAIDCSMGNVTIFNGPSIRSPPVMRICNNGASMTQTLATTVPLQTSRVRIVYQLRRLASVRGRFRMRIQAPVGICGGIIHALTGNITTPNYPGRHENVSCTWLILVPTGYHLKFQFQALFDVPQSSGACSENYLKAIEFPTSTLPEQLIPAAIRNPSLLPNQNLILPATCGITSAPPPFNSSRNGVAIFFTASQPAAGFGLWWNVGCGETFTDEFGVISSPNFPNSYADNLRCDYLIAPINRQNGQSSGRFIIIQFVAFNLEPSTACQYDSLTVFGGNLTSLGQQYGKFCGSTLPRSVAIASNTAVLRFYTDEAVNNTGFQIQYRATRCGGLLTEASGVFGTPTTPEDYPHGAECQWTLRAPVGKIVSLTFLQFGVEAHAQCVFDFVEIYDGSNMNNASRLIGKYCGRQLPNGGGAIKSTGRDLFVRFKSDHSVSDLGFQASYRHSFSCGGILDVPESDVVSTLRSFDADGDGNYEANLDCVWNLRLQPPSSSKILSVTFDTFQLESRNDCSQGDYVQVIDGIFTSDAANATLKQCGSSLVQKTVTSTGPNMVIVFHSNGAMNYRGFTARYSSVTPSCGGRYNATSVVAQLSWTPPASSSAQIRCQWQINSPSAAQQINISVVQLDLPSSPLCTQNYLELKDKEASPSSSNPAHYCGTSNRLPILFESQSDVVTVTYIRQSPTSSQPNPAFSLTFQAIGCNRTYTAASGRLTSPGFPNRYPRNVDCQILVQAPVGTLLALFFNYLDIERHSSCDFDYLQIRNGADNSAPIVGRFCNNATLPNPIFLDANRAFLHFHTDWSSEGGGFDITYSATTGTAGCGGNFSHVNGTFTSPRYPYVYPANVNCVWRVQLPSRYHIQVTFSRFSLLLNSTCATDNLSIYNGQQQTGANLYSSFCTNADVAPFTITSSSATFIFRSGSTASNVQSSTLSGFRLSYRGLII